MDAGIIEWGSAAAVIVVVGLFLRYIQQRDKAMLAIVEKQQEMTKEIGLELGRSRQVTEETLAFMKRLNGRLEDAVRERAR